MSDEPHPEHERRHLGDRIRQRIRELYGEPDDEHASTSADVLPTLREMFGDPDTDLQPDEVQIDRETFDSDQHRRRETTHPEP